MGHTRLALKFASISVTTFNSLVKCVRNFVITVISCMVLICLLLTVIGRDFLQLKFEIRGPVSVVGIAAAYGLDGPGIESWWGRDFPHLSRPALKSTHPPVQWIPDLSRW